MTEAKILRLGEPDYPRNLANPNYPRLPFHLPHPVVNRTEQGVPHTLYQLGTFSNTTETSHLAVIGSRNLTAQAERVIATFLPTFFTAFGQAFPLATLSIISGMTVGGDAAAQWLAFDNGIHTTGISATSINHPHRESDVSLYERLMVNPKTSVLSEYPATPAPAKEQYYDRNRIVAWMSGAVLAYGIQKPTSGAMHTISLARAMGIRVFYIESTVSPAVRTKLNQLGCIPVASAEDFIAKIKNPAL